MAINAGLYMALQKAFKGSVKVAKEGLPMRYVIKTNRITGKKRAEIIDDEHGEEYRVCCPFCTDERYRLWISHMWNTEDAVNGVTFGHLVNCFNDGCDLNFDTDSPERIDRVEELKSMISPLLRHTVNIQITEKETEDVIPKLPNVTTPIDQLEDRHSATMWLRNDRDFDVDQLANDWSVLYCPDDPHPFVDSRIIIPIYYDSDLAGWQARVPGKPSKQVPKYYTMPGMRKKRVIYNYDRASQYDVGVLVEGPTDAWTVGFQAVATFGAEVSPHQIQMMVNAWGNTGLILLSDGDVRTTKEKRARYERLRARLQETNAFAWGVLEVPMPEDKDPGDYASTDLWAMILHEAKRQNYNHPILCEHAYRGACRR